MIQKVKAFYENFIREIDFHISSGTRSGQIDRNLDFQGG